MTFTITGPDGQRVTLRPKVADSQRQVFVGLYYKPTYVLTLTAKGISDDAVDGAWADDKKAAFDAPGVYTIQVSGSLIRDKGEAIPFTSSPISVELGAGGIKTLAQVEASAREELVRKFPNAKPSGPATILENKVGNRLVRFTCPGQFWSYIYYRIEVAPDGTANNVTDREVGTCIARGTLVEGQGGQVRIEDIRVGDRVWGYDPETRQKVLTTVQFVRFGTAHETLVFGDTLRLTATHPVFIGGTWKAAGQVEPDETLLTTDLSQVLARKPRLIAARVEVFDLTVDGPHCYFAGGFLVHNKKRLYSPDIDDPWYYLWPTPKEK
jgi:hypothetical protein